MSNSPIGRLTAGVALAVAALFVCSLMPPGASLSTPAQAQRVSVDFEVVLKPYGQWRQHDRWGRVWIPAGIERGWRPYTVGHWVYTDEYGWYWVTDQREADWGWVVYHYGRWVLDADMGWVWVPKREWAPAWVAWRRGHDHLGWAPLPPDQVNITVVYRDQPSAWIFVRARDFTAPNIVSVVLAPQRQRDYLDTTVVVNRTVIVQQGQAGFAVNPGIEPTVVSAIVGQPLAVYSVQPHILAGTAAIPNAIEVRSEDLQGQQRPQIQVTAERTNNEIQPDKNVPEPQPLAENENGRLGKNPPKAAQQQGTEQPNKAADQQKSEEQPNQAAGQQKSEEQPNQAAGQQKGEEQPEKAAGQQKSEEQPNQAAGQEKSEEQPNKAADQQKSEEKPNQAAGQQKGQEPQNKAAQQKKGKEQPKSAGQKLSKPQGNRAAGKGAPRQQTEGRGADRGTPSQAKPEPSGNDAPQKKTPPGKPDRGDKSR